MKSRKKALLNAALVIIVFTLTLYYVFRGENLWLLAETIAKCKFRWLVPACFAVAFFIWGESYIIRFLLRHFGIRRRRIACFLLSSVGFFFSAITPSAGGGQPMQLYFMRKMKIPFSVSTIILMIVTITYKLVLVIVQLGILLFARDLVFSYLGDVLYIVYLGMALNVIGISCLILLVFCPRLVRAITGKTVNLLHKLRIIKKGDALINRVEESLDRYHDASEFLKRNFHLLIRVQLFTFAQRFALFSVTVFAYRALGLYGTPVPDILLLQSTISLSVDMLPLPGGMGASEYLFMNIFEPVFRERLLAGMVLSRGIAYYIQLLISGLGTAAAYLHIHKPSCFQEGYRPSIPEENRESNIHEKFTNR